MPILLRELDCDLRTTRSGILRIRKQCNGVEVDLKGAPRSERETAAPATLPPASNKDRFFSQYC